MRRGFKFLAIAPALAAFCSISAQENPAEVLLQKLAANSPFGSPPVDASSSIAEVAGISFKSAVYVDGSWRFSVVNKDKKSAWLYMEEECNIFPCRVTAFDEQKMAITVNVDGRSYDLDISDRASFAQNKVELAQDLMPQRRYSPQQSRVLWEKYATDQQKLEANKILAEAKANGRPLNRDDYRKLRAIERTIVVPEGESLPDAGPPPPPRQGGPGRPQNSPEGTPAP